MLVDSQHPSSIVIIMGDVTLCRPTSLLSLGNEPIMTSHTAGLIAKPNVRLYGGCLEGSSFSRLFYVRCVPPPIPAQ